MEDEARNVYREVPDRHVLRTADVYPVSYTHLQGIPLVRP